MSLYGDEHIKAMQKGECHDKIFLRSSRNNKRKPAVCTQRPGSGDLLQGQAPHVPPGRALAQQIQPQPCSSATSGPSLLPCFQAGEGERGGTHVIESLMPSRQSFLYLPDSGLEQNTSTGVQK